MARIYREISRFSLGGVYCVLCEFPTAREANKSCVGKMDVEWFMGEKN